MSSNNNLINDGRETKRRRLLPTNDSNEGSNNFKSPSASSCSSEEDRVKSLSEQSLSSSSGAATTEAVLTTTSDSGHSDAMMSSHRGNNGNGGNISTKRSRLGSCIETTSSSQDKSNIIQRPHSNDVLCGRGPGFYTHPGNVALRRFVQERKAEYILASDSDGKTKITNEVLKKLRQLDPPTRFLERTKDKQWLEVDHEKQFAKTSQALREGAPTMRAKAKAILKDDGSNKGRETLGIDSDILQPRVLHAALGIAKGETSIRDLTPAQLKAQSEMAIDGVLPSESKSLSISSADQTASGQVHVTGPFPPQYGQIMQTPATPAMVHQWPTLKNQNNGYESLMATFNVSLPINSHGSFTVGPQGTLITNIHPSFPISHSSSNISGVRSQEEFVNPFWDEELSMTSSLRLSSESRSGDPKSDSSSKSSAPAPSHPSLATLNVTASHRAKSSPSALPTASSCKETKGKGRKKDQNGSFNTSSQVPARYSDKSQHKESSLSGYFSSNEESSNSSTSNDRMDKAKSMPTALPTASSSKESEDICSRIDQSISFTTSTMASKGYQQQESSVSVLSSGDEESSNSSTSNERIPPSESCRNTNRALSKGIGKKRKKETLSSPIKLSKTSTESFTKSRQLASAASTLLSENGVSSNSSTTKVRGQPPSKHEGSHYGTISIATSNELKDDSTSSRAASPKPADRLRNKSRLVPAASSLSLDSEQSSISSTSN